MKSKQRVVIFSEYRKTQETLLQFLAEDLKLKPQEDKNKFDPAKSKAEIVGFNASVPESDQQGIVEAFAAENGKIKVLITTDIASEGVNLHYACHNLIHFDVPWSFITLEQRNGRIDRFGQKHQPHIYYLVYDTKNSALEKFKERWVVEKLLARAKQALKDQGDERLALKVFDSELENQKVITAYQQPEEDFMSLLFKDDFDETFGAIKGTSDLNLAPEEMPYLFTDLEFFERACKELKIKITDDDGIKKVEAEDDKIEILAQQIALLENELGLKKLKSFEFTNDQTKLIAAIDNARKEAGAWVTQHYLWENHPSVKIVTELTEGVFEKDHLPCILIDKDEGLNGATFVFHGSIANKFGQPIKSELIAAISIGDKFEFQSAISLFEEIGFKRLSVRNPSDKIKTNKQIKNYEKFLKSKLADSLKEYKSRLIADAIVEDKIRKPKLLEYSKKVDFWFAKKSEYLKKKYNSKNNAKRLEEELAAADKVKNNLHYYLKQQFDIAGFSRKIA